MSIVPRRENNAVYKNLPTINLLLGTVKCFFNDMDK